MDDHPLWWTEEEADRLLKGSVVEEEVMSMRKQVAATIETLKGIFWNFYMNEQMSKSADGYVDFDEDDANVDDEFLATTPLILSMPYTFTSLTIDGWFCACTQSRT